MALRTRLLAVRLERAADRGRRGDLGAGRASTRLSRSTWWPGSSRGEFADLYAQTLAYGLLAARWRAPRPLRPPDRGGEHPRHQRPAARRLPLHLARRSAPRGGVDRGRDRRPARPLLGARDAGALRPPRARPGARLLRDLPPLLRRRAAQAAGGLLHAARAGLLRRPLRPPAAPDPPGLAGRPRGPPGLPPRSGGGDADLRRRGDPPRGRRGAEHGGRRRWCRP